MDLREWTITYVKHKDLFSKKLVDFKEEDHKIVFRFKDHELHAYAMETLEIPPPGGKTLLVTLNKKENIRRLTKNFEKFCIPKLTIVFVNPEVNEKWFIVPHTHAMIADPNVELGISALAENVPVVE